MKIKPKIPNSKTIIQKLSKRVIVIILALIVIGVPLLYLTVLNQKEVKAAWYDEGWSFRQAITVTVASNSSDISNLETLVTIDTSTSGKFQSSCQDLRFTNQGGDLLSYYIDSGCGTSSTKVWVMVDLVPKNTTTYTMYMYYGNPSAPSASDSNKFKLFNGLVGYWTMNEASWNGTSGEVKDSSVNANNGVRAGNATTTASGKYSYAGTFNGSTDYVNVTSSITSLGSTFTVSVWLNYDSTGGVTNKHAIDIRDTPGSKSVIAFRPGTSDVFLRDDSAVTPTGGQPSLTYSAGWHHYVVVADGTNVMTYKDSSLSDTKAWGKSLTNLNSWRFGADQNPDNFFKGTIDEARIYNRALSASEVSQLYSNPGNIASNGNSTVKPTISIATEEKAPGPVAYWSFDDGQGQTAQDSASNNNDGTLGADSSASSNDPTWITEDQCVSGKCLKFDGGDYVNTVDQSYFSPSTNNISVSFWANIPVGASASGSNGCGNTGRYIVAKGNTSNWEWGIENDNNSRLCFITWSAGGSTNGEISVSRTMNDGKWHHYEAIMVYNTRMDLYVDGILVGSTTSLAQSMSNGTQPVEIGRRGDGNNFIGFIDEIKIYPYARTAAQVKADYNSRSSQIGASAQIGSSSVKSLSNGLVGYWKMDESSWSGTSADVLDASGNGNNGTAACSGTGCTKPTGAASGKYGNGGSFDGTNSIAEYVNLGTSSSLNPTSAITVSAWINPSASGQAWDAIISRTDYTTDWTNAAYNMTLNRNNYSVSFSVFGSDGVTGHTSGASSNNSITNGSWYLVTGTFDGTQVKLYINGVLASARPYTGSIYSSTYNTAIGSDAITRSASSQDSFYGLIDETRIYNRALSSKEVSDLYNFAPGPQGYWNFEEGSGTAVNDTSGQANSGTWAGTGTKHWDSGKYGKAGKFNGSDDYIDYGIGSTLNPTNGITVDTWVKLTSAPVSGQTIVSRWFETTPNRTYWLGIVNVSGLKFRFSVNGNDYYIDGTTVPVINTWYHVTGSWNNASGIKLYVNGISEGAITGTNPATINSNSSNTLIGAERGGSGNVLRGYLPGLIDDVKIYNYARSAKQIAADMNAGDPLTSLTSNKSPVGYWDFDEGFSTTANNRGSGGSALNGTLTGMSSPATATSGWTQAGKFGKGLLFDGSDDYVNTANESTFDFERTNPFSVSAWVKSNTASPTNALTILSKMDVDNPSVGSARGFVMFVRGDIDTDPYEIQIASNTSNNVVQVRVPRTADTNWHHLVMTYDGSSTASGVQIFVDGVAGVKTVVYDTLSATILHNINFEIGARDGSGLPFAGSLDEVKVYNYALTADEVKTEYNRGSSLVLGTAGNNSTYQSGAANQEYCVPGDSTSCAAPVGRWDFEEGKDNTCSATADVCDTSGNANNGTWNGTGVKHWDTGKVGKAGKFNGTDDYVRIPNSVRPTKASTVSLWTKPIGTGGQIFSSDNRIAIGISFSDTTSKFSFQILTVNNAYTSNEASFTSSINDWHHVVWSYDGSALTGYIDGKLAVNVQKTGNLLYGTPAREDTTIGAYCSGTPCGSATYFQGQIDQVRIFDYARSAAQVAWDYNKGKPVGHWDLDECQGSSVNDSSGNSNTGTITVATGNALGTCNTSSTFWGGSAGTGAGKRNYAPTFDGTDDYINLTNLGGLAKNQEYITLSYWIKLNALPGSGNYIAPFIETNANNGYTKFGSGIFNNGSFNAAWRDSATGSVMSITSDTGLITTGQWYHIVSVIDTVADTQYLYLNGVLKKNATTSTGTIYNDTPAYSAISGKPASGWTTTEYVNGQIDDVKIFNYALTSTQVKNEYNNGVVNFGPVSGAP